MYKYTVIAIILLVTYYYYYFKYHYYRHHCYSFPLKVVNITLNNSIGKSITIIHYISILLLLLYIVVYYHY